MKLTPTAAPQDWIIHIKLSKYEIVSLEKGKIKSILCERGKEVRELASFLPLKSGNSSASRQI